MDLWVRLRGPACFAKRSGLPAGPLGRRQSTHSLAVSAGARRSLRRPHTAALLAHAAVWGLLAPYGQLVAVGLVLAGLGLAWMAWAWWLFRRAGTTLLPTGTPRRLVDEGPFRIGRNPMYLGITRLMLGIGFQLGVPFMSVAAAAFAAIVHRVHIPYEERQMRRAFGGWYSDYAASVRRWL